VIVYIRIPHPPYVFGADGEPVYSDAAEEPTVGEEIEAGPFVNQTIYANHLLESTIRAILTNESRPPIIFLHADHGAVFSGSWDPNDREFVRARMGILEAVYLPPEVHADLYPTITPVNLFRVVSNAAFATSFTLQPDEMYFSPFRRLHDFVNVTAELRPDS
jgi:hypothetical protein